MTALPRRYFGDIHRIDLLQRLSLGLTDEEVHNKHCGKIACCKYIAVFESDVRNDEWRKERNQEIPYPIRRRDQCHGSCAVVAREEFADDTPDYGSPGCSVEGYKDAGEDYHCFSLGWGGLWVCVVEGKGADRGKDEEGGCHATTTNDKGFTTAEALDNV